MNGLIFAQEGVLAQEEHDASAIYFFLLNPKLPDYFGDISKTKAIPRKYLSEKCRSETNSQLPLKYFSNFCLISKLFLKVSQVQTTIVREIFKHEWVDNVWQLFYSY